MLLVFHFGGVQLTGHQSLEFLSRPALWPSLNDFLMLTLMGTFAAVASVMYTFAYKSAPSSFVAPFEYTAMIWAVLYGVLLFGDFPDAVTWVGMAIVITAGLFMAWRDARHKTG